MRTLKAKIKTKQNKTYFLPSSFANPSLPKHMTFSTQAIGKE